MPYQLRDRVIALAGLYQALKLVQQVALTGRVDDDEVATCLRSLFAMEADDCESVFGQCSNLKLGFETLITQLGGCDRFSSHQFDGELTCYFVNVVILQRKIYGQKEKLKLIAENLGQAQIQIDHYGITHENTIARIADIYVSNISRLRPRIMVSGEPVYLTNSNNANKIRALLLAAIRSAVLWQQTGGRRWQLLFQRGSYVQIANEFVDANVPCSQSKNG